MFCFADVKVSPPSITTLIGGFLVLLTTNLGWSQGIRIVAGPTNNQLFARDVRTNLGTISIQGLVARTSRFDRVQVKTYRETTVFNTQEQALTFPTDSTKFNFTVKIPAELFNYKIEIYGMTGATATRVWTAEKIVAGDVFIINGQSNAEGRAAVFPTDIDEFSRSYTFENGWNPINRSLPGQWGGRFAKRMIEIHKIPIAIFNQAVGGQLITFYLRNNAAPVAGNYGSLLQRLQAAGIKNAVRAAFWFHGEADGWQTTTEDYKTRFLQLHQAWKQDFGVSNSFIFQMRQGSCTAPSPRIAEAHRQLAAENLDIFTISTLNAAHDSCHFDYELGYKTLAERLVQLVSNELYASTYAGAHSPDVLRAFMEDAETIKVKFKTNGARLSVIGNPFQYVSIESETLAQIKNISVVNDEMIVKLQAQNLKIKTISYIGHPGKVPHWIVNPQNGNSILSFYKVPVEKYTPNAPPIAEDPYLFQIVRNPMRDVVAVRYQVPTGVTNLEMTAYDFAGKKYFSFTKKLTNSEGKLEYEFDNLPDGHYLLHIYIPSKNIYQTLKFSVF